MSVNPNTDDGVKKHPLSGPKPSDPNSIPRIVLDDRADPSTGSASIQANTSIVVTTPASVLESPSEPHHDYVPHRCNSDIGLPTTSMPNLTLALALSRENGGSCGDTLGVYCSPRTTRRSVDLDVGPSRDPARAEYHQWLDEQSGSLRVLTSNSRVGSAVSLNSVCTAHSVGLLSNDSSDEYQDNSLHESGISSTSVHERPSQLRRLLSYPEDTPGVESGISPRISHSLCNLKAAQAHGKYEGQSQSLDPISGQGLLTPERLCMLPSDVDDAEELRSSGGELGQGEETLRQSEAVALEVCEDKANSRIVCYGKGSKSMRDGRIRRWLQDMDQATG